MFCEAASSSEGEQDNFCIGVIQQDNVLLAGFRWLDFIHELADLVVLWATHLPEFPFLWYFALSQ